MKTFEPYFLVLQQNTAQFAYPHVDVPVPVWTSESFLDVQAAQDAIAAFCGHDPETIERGNFVILEISPPPKDQG